MGWLIVGIIMLGSITIIAHFNSKRQRPGRHRVPDVEIYDRVERECLESGEKQGEFEIDLAEISDLAWLEVGNHEFSRDQFRTTVKWRYQGNQCIYKFVASAGEGENSLTKHSKKYIIPLES